MCHICVENYFSVVEVSNDGKQVQCKTCEAMRGHHSGWIKKESLTYHLGSETHARCIRDQQSRELIRAVAEESMEQEREMEQDMDFAILSSESMVNINDTVRIMQTHVPSAAEQEMWDNGLNNEGFDAGVDHTADAVEERNRLEREATDFDLWHGSDFVPEHDPSDISGLLLQELEQDDIIAELLRNASTYRSSESLVQISFSDRIGCTRCIGDA
jgi:hypothetical protein